MPKYTPNRTLIESISGAIGDLVFYRDAQGNLIVQHKGERTRPPSVDQWLYTTATAIPSGTPIVVEATAADRPGHLGMAKVQFFVG